MLYGDGELCDQVIAQNLQNLDPKSDGAKRDWVAIYDECASVLYEVCTFTRSSSFAVLHVCTLHQELVLGSSERLYFPSGESPLLFHMSVVLSTRRVFGSFTCCFLLVKKIAVRFQSCRLTDLLLLAFFGSSSHA